jgi:hypothetical protein
MHDTPVTFDEFKQIVNRQEGPVLGTRKASDIDMGTFVIGLTNNVTLISLIPFITKHTAQHYQQLNVIEVSDLWYLGTWGRRAVRYIKNVSIYGFRGPWLIRRRQSRRHGQ